MVYEPMTEKKENKKEELKEAEVKEPEVKEVPEICTFKGVRRIVMKRVWAEADQLELEGKPMLIGDFGKLVTEKWAEVKKEIPKVCQIQSIGEPTAEPSKEPTAEPSKEPTAEPSKEPTAEPSKEPSKKDSVE